MTRAVDTRAIGNIADTARLTTLLGIVFHLSMASATTTTIAVTDAAPVRASDAPATMLFPITRSGDTSYPAAVSYHTVDGTALAGSDYVAAAGSITIPAGAAAASVPVMINANAQGTQPLNFQLQLDGATGIGPTPEFAAPHGFHCSMGSFIAVAVDLNGDGKLDLVAANRYSNSVSVLFNTTVPGATAATFASKVDYSVGANPMGVATADINRDGKPDLIVTSYDTNTVTVLLNTTPSGATVPTFSAQTTFPVGTNPWSVTAADVNGDGRTDLIVANSDGTLSVLRNTTAAGAATPTLGAQNIFTDGYSSGPVVAADINGDGRLDLIVPNFGGGASILLNATAPGAAAPNFAALQSFATSPNAQGLAVADINGDGKLDLITSSVPDAVVTVVLNTSAPGSSTLSFSASREFPIDIGALSVAVADINGDGKADLVTANLNTSLSVLVNTTVPGSPLPSFASEQVIAAVGMNPNMVALADMNGDGKADIVVANLQSDTLSVLINATPAPAAAFDLTPQQTFASGSGSAGVIAVDINADGHPDLVVADSYVGTTTLLMNNTLPGAALPSFVPAPTLQTTTGTAAAAAVDLNGDGKPDLLFLGASPAELMVYINTTAVGAAQPSFAARQSFKVPDYSSGIEIADVNLDGKPDLVFGSSQTYSFAILLNTTAPGSTAATFSATQSVAAGAVSNETRAVDINGDGKPDVLAVDHVNNRVQVFVNQSAPGTTTPVFSMPISFATETYPGLLEVVDVNGDGKPDLVTANAYANSISVLRNTTAPGAVTPQFAVAQNFNAGAYPYFLLMADMNGDGRRDALVSAMEDNAVTILANRTAIGATTFSFDAPMSYATGDPYSQLAWMAAADLNGDGKPDVIVDDYLGPSVYVRLNEQYLGEVSPTKATGTILPERIFADGFE